MAKLWKQENVIMLFCLEFSTTNITYFVCINSYKKVPLFFCNDSGTVSFKDDHVVLICLILFAIFLAPLLFDHGVNQNFCP